MSKLSDMLIFLRKRRGLTQEELATLIKISRSAIGMYESGKREPNLETLEVFADFYNVDMNTLTGKSSEHLSLQEKTPTAESGEQEDPDLYMIARARKNMTDEEREDMMKVLKISFKHYFSDDYVDDDVDE